MKTWMMVTVSVALTAGTPGQILAQHKSTPSGWLTDYIAARELARKTGKPLMVVFRCGP
jgi:hypothetical protein